MCGLFWLNKRCKACFRFFFAKCFRLPMSPTRTPAYERAQARLQPQETSTVLRGGYMLKPGADPKRVRSVLCDLADTASVIPANLLF